MSDETGLEIPGLLISEIPFESSAEIGQIAGALAKAQGVMANAVKSAKNPFYKTSYADLGAVMDVIRKPLADNEIAIVQCPANESDTTRIHVMTRLIHSSGQWFGSRLTAEAKDTGPQAIGSVITYLRRYQLSALAGVATEDDDGEAAEAREKPQPVRDAPPARPPAQSWKKPAPAPPMRPNPPPAKQPCIHGVSAPNRCLECAAHESS